MSDALAELQRGCDEPALTAGAVRALGIDAPRELLLAAGLHPVRLSPASGAPTPRADAIMGSAALGLRGKRLIEAILDERALEVPVLITQADQVQPQIFSALRELRRLGERVPEVHFLDLLHIDRDSSRAYNRHRLAQLVAWLERLSGRRVTGESIAEACAGQREQAEALDRLDTLRRLGKVSGTDALTVIAAASILPSRRHRSLLGQFLDEAEAGPVLAGARLIVAGSPHETSRLYAAIEDAGTLIVGETHGGGAAFLRPPSVSTLEAFADPVFRAVPRALSPAAEAERAFDLADACGAEAILHLTIDGDEAAPWDAGSLGGGRPLLALRAGLDPAPDFGERVRSFRAGESAPPAAAPKLGAPRPKPAPAPQAGQRSRKSLESVASFSAYQRGWFASVRDQVAAGAPFAVVNANAPQEILRALGIPFVVNQWWASIVAAKQQSRRYLALLAERGLPTDVEAYSAQGLAAAFDEDGELRPWGGLPRPDFVHAVASSDPSIKIFDQWARATGAECFVYERTVDPRAEIGTDWWDELPDRWDEVLEPERIDLMVAELRTVIAAIEARTGRTFDEARFREVMDLVNEQEEYYRRTRDLVAATVPAPIGVVDQVPATMVPQWHRGTVWARDAAKAFYDEVKARADAGLAAVPNERVRLMWVGRGLWSDMGFYQKWEESHGAVFVWSMYLGLAADGYIRRMDGGREPLRALASRFLTMGDELRMPTWAGPWHVHEARTHQVDGAVALADADPFVVRALRAAGIPVVELTADNFSRDPAEGAAMESAITAFIEGPATERAAARTERVHAGA